MSHNPSSMVVWLGSVTREKRSMNIISDLSRIKCGILSCCIETLGQEMISLAVWSKWIMQTKTLNWNDIQRTFSCPRVRQVSSSLWPDILCEIFWFTANSVFYMDIHRYTYKLLSLLCFCHLHLFCFSLISFVLVDWIIILRNWNKNTETEEIIL